MKVRQGFVSNSSSSSFVVAKAYLTGLQIGQLIEFCEHPVGEYRDTWNITVDEYNVRGFTCMNNNMSDEGGLEDWMTKRGFPMPAIVWEYD
jgi:hypothetical protein